MTAWPSVEFIAGFAFVLALPDWLIEKLGGIMRRRINGWVHDHFLESIIIVLVIAVMGCGVGFLAFGYSLASNRAQNARSHALAMQAKKQAEATQRQFTDYKACVNAYAHRVHVSLQKRTIAAQRLDSARGVVETDSRRLWALVAKGVSGATVPPEVAKKALGIYLADSAREERLRGQLTQARLQHPTPVAPAKACP